MAFITNRGQRIHFTVDGQGPTVVFQNGMFQCASDWRESGWVDAFSDAYRVVCIDSLGHGESAKPSDPVAYRREAVAADVVGVLDKLGAPRAHLFGYSMGGWIASGVALASPDRLASLVIGGFNIVGAAAKNAAEIMAGHRLDDQFTGDEEMDIEALLAGARTLAPKLCAWVTPDDKPGLQAAYDAINGSLTPASPEFASGQSAVASLRAPVLIWDGVEDPAHEPMRVWAEGHELQFLSVPGDHISAMSNYAKDPIEGTKETIEGVRAFVDRAEAAS